MIECPDFLPLGSVVTLKGSPKTLLVIARGLVVETDEGKRYYDYGMCLYPEGLMGDAVVYSNHDCISEVLFKGFSDENDEKVLATLAEVLPETNVPRGEASSADAW